MLLALTALGVAAMHTLGHDAAAQAAAMIADAHHTGAHQRDGHTTVMSLTGMGMAASPTATSLAGVSPTAVSPVEMTADVGSAARPPVGVWTDDTPPTTARGDRAGPAAGCACGHLRLTPAGHDMGGCWSICLAVITSTGVLLAAGPLLAGLRSDQVAGWLPGGLYAGSRAPPRLPVGLTVAALSVLRR